MESLSNTLSKKSAWEDMSLVQAAMEDAAGHLADETEPASISNERICRGDRLMQTYEVVSDAMPGGMGSVWRVRHLAWNRDLAMKRPQPRFFAEGSPRSRERFIRECEYWIDLGLHPNVVSCYYVRLLGGVPTVFSEWMDGGSLKDRIGDGTLYAGTAGEAAARILGIAIQTARGLRYAHRNGLIHQDVKPGNVLLTARWEAKIADFGLARLLRESGGQGRIGSEGFTLAYSPGEQTRGEAAAPWMDVYAWALTVLEMYAGGHPWGTGEKAAEAPDKLYAACRIPVPEAVRGMITQCLSGRTYSLERAEKALAEAYRALTGGEYPQRPEDAARDTADVLNNRALSFLDLGKMENARTLWRRALEIAPEHPSSVYNLGLMEWRGGKIDDTELLRRCGQSGSDADRDTVRRLTEQIRLERAELTDRPLKDLKARVSAAGFPRTALSPDGQRIYTLQERLACFDASTLARRFEKPAEQPGSPLFGITEDGKTLYYRDRDGAPRLIDAAAGEAVSQMGAADGIPLLCGSGTGQAEVRDAHGADRAAKVLCQSPDGSRLFCFDLPGGRMMVAGADFGLLTERPNPHRQDLFCACFTGDGKTVYTGGGSYVARLDADTLRGQEIRLEGGAARLFRSTGGRFIAAEAAGGEVFRLVEAASGMILQTVRSRDARLAGLSEEDGFVRAVFCCRDGSIRTVEKAVPGPAAPWEVCAVQSFREAEEAEARAARLEARIKDALDRGDARSAAGLLAEAEELDDSSRFLPLRRQVYSRCVPGALKGISALNSPELPGNAAYSAVFHPRTGTLAVSHGGRNGSAVTFMDGGLAPCGSFSTGCADAPALRFSDSGKLLCCAFTGGLVQVRDAEDGRLLMTAGAAGEGRADAAVDPEDRLLAAVEGAGGVVFRTIPEGKVRRQVKRSLYGIYDLCFLKDGRTVFARENGSIRVTKGYRRLGKITRQVFEDDEEVRTLLRSRDGERLFAACTDEIVLLDGRTLEKCGKLEIPFDRDSLMLPCRMAVSADGLLFAAARGNRVHLWSLKDRKIAESFSVPERTVRGLSFSPDGALLCACCEGAVRIWALRRDLAAPAR